MFSVKYTVKDMAYPSSFLGWSIQQIPNAELYISQPTRIDKPLSFCLLENASGNKSPLPSRPNFDTCDHSLCLDTQGSLLFISFVGGLCYLTDSFHENISFSKVRLPRYSKNPSKCHMACANTFYDLLGEQNTSASYSVPIPTAHRCNLTRIQILSSPMIANPEPAQAILSTTPLFTGLLRNK